MPDPGWQARRRIIGHYARRDWRGRIAFCTPSKNELNGVVARRETSGSDGKVIFPDLETAEKAAREMADLGADPQRAYVCARSRTGHAHLTRMQWGDVRG